jgi:hypothetical protein
LPIWRGGGAPDPSNLIAALRLAVRPAARRGRVLQSDTNVGNRDTCIFGGGRRLVYPKFTIPL